MCGSLMAARVEEMKMMLPLWWREGWFWRRGRQAWVRRRGAVRFVSREVFQSERVRRERGVVPTAAVSGMF